MSTVASGINTGPKRAAIYLAAQNNNVKDLQALEKDGTLQRDLNLQQDFACACGDPTCVLSMNRIEREAAVSFPRGHLFQCSNALGWVHSHKESFRFCGARPLSVFWSLLVPSPPGGTHIFLRPPSPNGRRDGRTDRARNHIHSGPNKSYLLCCREGHFPFTLFHSSVFLLLTSMMCSYTV